MSGSDAAASLNRTRTTRMTAARISRTLLPLVCCAAGRSTTSSSEAVGRRSATTTHPRTAAITAVFVFVFPFAPRLRTISPSAWVCVVTAAQSVRLSEPTVCSCVGPPGTIPQGLSPTRIAASIGGGQSAKDSPLGWPAEDKTARRALVGRSGDTMRSLSGFRIASPPARTRAPGAFPICAHRLHRWSGARMQ